VPIGTQIAAAKMNTHIIDRNAPFRVNTDFEVAT